MPFADLHCHPSFWSFNKFVDSRIDTEGNPEIHIWDIVLDKSQLQNLEKGKRAAYAQSDFASLSKGEVMLVFAALLPVEKGFFMGNKSTGNKADVVGGLLNFFLINKSEKIRNTLTFRLRYINKPLSRLFNNERWARDILQKIIMYFSTDRINFLQSKKYDYYDALRNEYAFYKKYDGVKPMLPAPSGTRPYKLIQNNRDLRDTLNDNQQIAVVLTIEGLHALCLEPDPDNGDYLRLVDDVEILKRIKIIKNDWNVFFITFSHHYDNQLAGHAHSLPRVLTELTNQAPRMNEGMIPKAEEYMRKLLSITSDNKPDMSGERRVLIDVKHFSALSRKAYYNNIILPYNLGNEDHIPVIASHCGYYGPLESRTYVELSDLTDAAKEEDDDSIKDGFYKWNINLCDEDVKVIVCSGGLIGLCFDQRIMGEREPNEKSLQYWINVIGRHILGFVASAIQNVKHRPERIWDCLCLGTDFDGFIDPLDSFPAAQKMNIFKTELSRFLHVISEMRGEYLFLNGNPYTPKQVVEKIVFENACNFTLKHFK